MTNRILNIGTGFKDGEEGNDEHLTNILIDVVENGFLITAVYTDETESKFIAPSLKELNETVTTLVRS